MPLPDRLLIVTDRHQARTGLEDTVRGAVAGGARWIWLRDRDLDPDARRDLADRLRAVTKDAGAALTIGASIALADLSGADGVHLRAADRVGAARARLGARALIGVSAHCAADVRRAAEAGADYASLSPIFATASKPGYGPALGLAALRDATDAGIPVVALGGLTAENVADCRLAGAAGVAVMGCVMGATDAGRMVRILRERLEFTDANRRSG